MLQTTVQIAEGGPKGATAAVLCGVAFAVLSALSFCQLVLHQLKPVAIKMLGPGRQGARERARATAWKARELCIITLFRRAQLGQ